MAEDVQRHEMATLRELLDEAVAGRGRVAMVTGAIATGKSALLHGLAEGALDRGVLSLTATGSRAEGALPLGVLSQLVLGASLSERNHSAALGLLREGIRRYLPAGRSGQNGQSSRTGQNGRTVLTGQNGPAGPADPVGPMGPAGPALPADPASGEQMDVLLVDALCAVLLELSERCPLLIVVDDLHHADRASRLCLSHLARRIAYARIMLVFSMPDPHALGSLHAEMLRQPHCRTVRLGHLSLGEVTRLAAGDAGVATAARWHALTGGNRLLVDALLEDHRAGDGRGERYAEAVLACLHRAEGGSPRVARALAVLGEAGPVSRLLGENDAVTAKTVQELTRAGLLEGGRFRDEAARSAVLAGLDDHERVDLHRRAAELTYHDGAPAPVVAGHLLRAGHAGEPWALPILEEAAARALRQDGVESAIAYLMLALRSCPDERRRARIATTLVRAKWRIDPGTPAGQLAELTEALRRGHLTGGDAVVLAKALLWHGHAEAARDVLGHLRRLDELDRDAVAELAVAHAWFRSSFPSFLPHLPALTDEQTGGAAHSLSADRRTESADALVRALTQGPLPETAATAERILRGSRLDEMSMDTVESALLALTYTGRADLAAPWCDSFIAEAASRRAPSRQARLSAIRAEIGLRRGDPAAAAADAQRALELIPPDSWGVAVGGPLGSLLLAGAAMGRHEEFLPPVNRPVPEAMLETRFGLQYLYGKGRFHLAAGQPRQALRDLRLCGELMGEWKLDSAEFIAWRLDAAQALVALGEMEEARRLVEEQLTRSGGSRRVQGMALRVLAATAEKRHRVILLRQSADLLEDGGDRYELARSLIDLTEAYHAAGEFRRAAMLSRRARALAQGCQAGVLSRALPDGGEGGEGVWAGTRPVLSDAERRVAALAADGYSNREVAAKLFITVSTVEQHLTRVYRKLSVTRRGDLPEGLTRERI
ncbi:AAA family ATPase [Streptosporangium sp. NPDC002524]|uniref:helix-turn-helix transcriptional regulator n=1 Tax=Streptosporangium sp. NPDC002524 TaxID=3154537 RepID=UPI0033215002